MNPSSTYYTCFNKLTPVKSDILGLLLAIISLMPFAVITGFLTLIIFRRDLHTIVFFGGVVGNEIVNFLLKHTIQEARPMERDGLYSEYGMPSTHAQFMWFFATYMTLFVIIRLHQSSNSTLSERFWRVLIIALSIFSAGLVTYGRIYLQYHSHFQVLCGAILGIILGIVWFIVVHLVLTPFFPMIVSWKLSEYFLLRDTTLIPNILWFEYTNIRTEARARSRKLVSMKSQ
ncbi:dolichyldiphosphatase 1-like isoform X2 [Phymastichus coffea]|uniref:dolichyldiphosphatase 1-like isoform X2 n=1 Tax=Phymastichus coffea TaxID=108790 RepID=UPI00273AC4AC|nr:dolichyldiphosphatase 1-like isoform X2 [Phymastichus coffea]